MHIKLEKFEGPLGLLLELIEGRKLEVTEISLAQVTDQFLEYLKKDTRINAGNLADFIVVASKLILIKSKALLPFLELTQEEEEDIADLEKQLREYKRFRKVAEELKVLFSKRNICFSRSYQEIQSDLFYPPKNITAENLSEFFKKILDDTPVISELPKDILKSKISIEEKIKEITDLIQKRVDVYFHSLNNTNQGKEHLVANFLAMLELTKQKLITVEQTEILGVIKIIKI